MLKAPLLGPLSTIASCPWALTSLVLSCMDRARPLGYLVDVNVVVFVLLRLGRLLRLKPSSYVTGTERILLSLAMFPTPKRLLPKPQDSSTNFSILDFEAFVSASLPWIGHGERL